MHRSLHVCDRIRVKDGGSARIDHHNLESVGLGLLCKNRSCVICRLLNVALDRHSISSSERPIFCIVDREVFSILVMARKEWDIRQLDKLTVAAIRGLRERVGASGKCSITDCVSDGRGE